MTNVLLIVCDALRARNLPEYGYPLMTAPNITKLCNSSYVYRRAYSQFNYTTASVASILTGKYGFEHGISQLRINKNDEYLQVPTIADRYNSTHDTIFLNDLLVKTFDNKGKIWARFDYAPKYGSGIDDNWTLDKLGYPPYTRAEETTDCALHCLDKEPFFMYVHYWDAHFPWMTPEEEADDFLMIDTISININKWISKLTNKGKKAFSIYYPEGLVDNLLHYIAWYDSEIRYMDKHIGRLLKEVPDDTLIIISADHAEAFGEHGCYFSHSQGGLYEEVIHVPLIVNYPDNEHKTIYETIENRRIYDIMDAWLYGRDKVIPYSEFVYSTCRKEKISQWDSLIHGRYKIICKNLDLDKLATYNLFIDPEEKTPLPLPQDEFNLLKQKLREFMLKWYLST